eukprot:6599027-Pyramimonas_sp.AAC.1
MSAFTAEPSNSNSPSAHGLHPEVLAQLLGQAYRVEGHLDVHARHVHGLGPIDLEPPRTVACRQAHSWG